MLDDKKFLGHPRGVGALAAGNFFNSFAWGALYAILIYYLYSPYTQGLGFTQGQAASMVTAMGACNSIFIILGSWLADRVLGMRKALIIGNIVKGTAFGLLAIPAFSLAQGRIFAILALFLMSLPINEKLSHRLSYRRRGRISLWRRDLFHPTQVFRSLGRKADQAAGARDVR
ncbi:hypothetical protein NYE69_15580 [Paenibacillus sp. FSL R5-0527]|uniref:hypothetical protein n=1 Tax=Paenibacillus sp. FSL R5-0527 TaxID=2975321 RepID=UPI0030F75280